MKKNKKKKIKEIWLLEKLVLSRGRFGMGNPLDLSPNPENPGNFRTISENPENPDKKQSLVWSFKIGKKLNRRVNLFLTLIYVKIARLKSCDSLSLDLPATGGFGFKSLVHFFSEWNWVCWEYLLCFDLKI